MTPNKRMDEIIAAKLVDTMLDKGYQAEIHYAYDADDKVAELTSDREILIKNLCSFDEELIEFKRKGNEKYSGWFFLVWGNGVDIISDYTDNAESNEIYEVVEKFFNL